MFEISYKIMGYDEQAIYLNTLNVHSSRHLMHDFF